MQRQNITATTQTALQLANGPLNLIRSRHENQNIALGFIDVGGDSIRSEFPNGIVFGFMIQMLNLHRKDASLGAKTHGRLQIFLQFGPVEGR